MEEEQMEKIPTEAQEEESVELQKKKQKLVESHQLEGQRRAKAKNDTNLGCGIIILVVVAFFLGFVSGEVFVSMRSADSTSSNSTSQAISTKILIKKATPTSIPTQQPTPTPTPIPVPTWHQIEVFTGNGSEKTVTFTVSDQWKMSWSCNPVAYGSTYNLAVDVDSPDTNLPVDPAAINTICQQGNTQGVTQEYVSGTIYLSILSESTWKIVVEDYS